MPAVTLHPPSKDRASNTANPLPQLLQTPSGLAIVEIQGTVKSTLSSAQKGPDGAVMLGKLTFPHYDPATSAADTSWQKRVYLYVGQHQRLTGEVKKLANPIAVIRRRLTDADADAASGGVEELEVAEIVYFKLLFAHRPEPVGTGGG
ncbi:hypothetical protein LTR08_005277 [Meristemomyces frigidus]|nr:hypothetical protein LTR08_005277 [Meristemomyces frigidus]